MNFSCYTIPLHPEVQDLSGTETAKLSAILSAPQVQKEEDVAIQEESAIVEQPKKEVDQPKNWINRYTIGFAFIILVILWLIGESKRSFWRGMTYTVNQHGNLVGSYTGDASWLDAFHPAEIVASISYGINELLPIVLMVGVGLFIIMFLLSVSAETNKETNSDPDTKSITKEDILPQILGLFPHESTYSSSLPSEWLGKNRLKPSLFDTKTIEESFFPNTKNLFRSFGSTPVDDFVYIQAPRYSICSGETMRVIRKSSKRGNTYTRTYYQTFQLSLRWKDTMPSGVIGLIKKNGLLVIWNIFISIPIILVIGVILYGEIRGTFSVAWNIQDALRVGGDIISVLRMAVIVLCISIVFIIWEWIHKIRHTVRISDKSIRKRYNAYRYDRKDKVDMSHPIMQAIMEFIKKTHYRYSVLYTPEAIYIQHELWDRRQIYAFAAENPYSESSPYLNFYIRVRDIIELADTLSAIPSNSSQTSKQSIVIDENYNPLIQS